MILTDSGQRRRAAVPVLLTVAVYLGALAGVAVGAEPLVELVWSEPDAAWTFSRVTWLLVRWGIALVLFVGLCFLFTAVLEIVAGPFFDRMVQVELQRRGVDLSDPGFWDGTVLEALRAIAMAIPIVIFAALTLIPALTLIAGTMGTAWAWFGLGAGAVNPSLVQTGFPIRARLRFLKTHYGWVLGLGAAIGLMLVIPVVGWIGLPAGVIGAARRFAPSRSEGARTTPR